MVVVLVLHLDSTAGNVRERSMEDVKKQLTMRESVPLASRSSHLSQHWCPASGVPYSRVAAVVEVKTRASAVSEVHGEEDPGPREAQSVTGRLDCLSGQGGSSGAQSTALTYLIVR
jgi:hypothetical protein